MRVILIIFLIWVSTYRVIEPTETLSEPVSQNTMEVSYGR